VTAMDDEPSPGRVRGGKQRWTDGDPEEVAATRRRAAATTNSPASLARRLVKAWPALTRAERAEVRAILAPLMPRDRPIGGQ
jgi:hypothetical protein